MIRRHPTLYEINTRVWLHRFSGDGSIVKLNEAPEEYWNDLRKMGIDAVWLMGIWETNNEIVERYCFEDGLVNEYKKALKDWRPADVSGSPYSIKQYKVNPEIGSEADLRSLKELLNGLGIKLILDFVPNHFSVGSDLLHSNPEIFLSVPSRYWDENKYTFFRLDGKNEYYAHGRDPFFPAWQDTAQVNYFSADAREFMVSQLLNISELCDGLRCDMAMLALNNVFANTWGIALSEQNIVRPEKEFWELAANAVRDVNPEFIFIAEAYWDLEYNLQQLGFDFTYDKKLTDRLRAGNVFELRGHLNADFNYQRKSLRFIENHDEERAVTAFGQHKERAAAVVTSTIMGMRFFHDGQFEGRKIKLPVQLNREPAEKVNKWLKNFYSKLLSIINEEVFHDGEWTMHYPVPAGPGDETYHNMLAWQWVLENERRLVVVNFSDKTARCRIRLNLEEFGGEFGLIDLWNKHKYVRNKSESVSRGVFIELGPYNSHIFKFIGVE